MSKVKADKRINVLQNIQIEEPKIVGSEHKRRLTTSMLILGEEPIFSDSEEELEYTRAVFGIAPPVINKYCEAAVQCDILTNEKISLFSLINQCSNLQADNAENFKEIIESCQRFIAKQSFPRDDSDTYSEFEQIAMNKTQKHMKRNRKSYGERDLNKVSTAKNKLDKKRSSINRKNFEINEDENCIPSKKQTKIDEKNKIDNKKHDDSGRKSQRISNRRSATNQKEIETQTSDDEDDDDLVFKRPFDVVSSARHWRATEKHHLFSSTKMFDDKDPPFKRYSENLDASSFREKLPRNIVKPLARNWMKPHKSLCLEDSFKLGPKFTSLQLTKKVRRLYSPSQWLISQDFSKVSAKRLEHE